MITNPPPLRVLVCSLVLLSWAAAAEKPAATEETIELSPFVVSTQSETGYAATNTLDGSRLNTALRDTPGAISVFTKDFLDDIGATNLEEMLRYDVSGVTGHAEDDPDGGGAQAHMFGEGVSFRMRELNASISTDGFRTAGVPNMYNVERVASGRGPNAILFGTSGAGGNLNFRTRAPMLARNLTTLDLKVAGESTKRGVLDVNHVLLKDRLALRVMGTWDRKGSPQPYQYTDFEGITVAASYRFKRDTDLTVSYQRDHTEGVSGREWNHLDAISRFTTLVGSGQIRWNPALERYENANGTALANAAAGIGTVGHRNVIVYGPDMSLAPALWEGTSTSVNRQTLATNASVFNGATTPIVHEEFERYGSVTSSGAGEFAGVSQSSLTATLNHRLLSHLFMELAYNHSTRASNTLLGQNPTLAADLNYRLPDGSLNPYWFGNGYYFSEQNYLRLDRVKNNDTGRASFSYELDLGKRWGSHRFAVMGEQNRSREARLRMREVWAGRPFGGNPEAAANQIFRRRYFQIGGPSANYTSGYQPGDPFNRDAFRSSFSSVGTLSASWAAVNDRDFDDEITTDSAMAVMQNYFFERRLVTTFGARSDTITSIGPRTLRDPVTGFFRFATPADQAVFTPTQKDWFSRDKQRGLRRSMGAVFHLTRNFSLTANYSDGVELPERNRSVLPNDETPPPVKGRGYDVGVSFSFLENRISGSVKGFESKSLGERTQGGADVYVNPNNDVMSSFDHYFRLAGLTTFGPNDPIKAIGDLTSIYFSSADSFLGDRISKGAEFEMVANPTRNWTLRAGYSYTDRTKTNIFQEAGPWWADRLAFWKSLDAIYTARTGRPSIYNQLLFDRNQATGAITVAQRIAQADTELATTRAEEQQAYGLRPHKANLWTRYAFSTGALRGLAVGGGWRYQSANIAGVDLATNRKLLGNPRSLFDLFLQYKSKTLLGPFLGASNVTYQLNVTNLFDDRTINATKLDVDSVTGVIFARRAIREDPRTVAFSVRTEF